MPLSSGARLGPYEILSPIGAGGMGEVYKARDTRLDRTVAIKLIQPHVAAHPEFRERFDREARAISALDHPHICTLYDVGHDSAGGTDYLVMQYLEGVTLADRMSRAGRPLSDPTRPPSSSGEVTLSSITRGPIPLETTLRYGAEIAHALDAAHRRQIVHRDLKPGNVMLTKSGTKLLDFGLAKLAATAVSLNGLPVDATRTSPPGISPSPLTGQSALLGTLYYMSPEQLEGHDVDARSDIFSFGGLLYEMLTGRRAFARDSHAGVIAAILADDTPRLGELADTRTPLPIVARRALDRLVQKCLAKNPEERWQSAADLAAELTWINEERIRAVEEPAVSSVPVPVSRAREHAWMAAAIVLLTALVAIAWSWYPRPAAPVEAVTFTIDPPENEAFTSGPGLLAVSNDGRQLAFITGEGDSRRLWIRSFRSLAAQRLDGVTSAWQPFWSPEDRYIAYTGQAADPLRRIEVAGGSPMTIADASGRPAWGSGGVIIFTNDRRLYRVAAAGGQPQLVIDLDRDRRETNLSWPLFLPDGKRFIFTATAADRSKSAIFLASLDSPGRTHLVDALSNVDYAKGHIFYQREGTLVAQPFDETNGRTTGEAIPIVENIRFNQNNGRGAFSVSAAGVLAYRSGGATGSAAEKTLAWFDRSGKLLGPLGGPGDYLATDLSPDGRRLVVAERDDESSRVSLTLFDLDRGVPTRFSVRDVDELSPVWSPDGESVVFSSTREGKQGIYRRAAGGGATTDELLHSAPEQTIPQDISNDGRTLLFTQGRPGRRRLWAVPLDRDRKAFEVYPGSGGSEPHGTFSPDGKWIAYASGEGGTLDIYVRPFPADARRIRVSAAGGSNPRWTRDGRRLIYRAADDALMSVDLTMVDGRIRPGTPQRLFLQRRAGPFQTGFSMDPGGERFLLVLPPERQIDPRPAPITVVLNVEALLKAKSR